MVGNGKCSFSCVLKQIKMEDRNYLIEMYNATSTDDDKGDIETYWFWLERQLLSRIKEIEQLNLHNVISRQFNEGEPVKWAGATYYIKRQDNDNDRVLITGCKNVEDESYNAFWLSKTAVR